MCIHVDLNTLHFTLITVHIEGVSIQLVGLVGGHLRKFLLQRGPRLIIHQGRFLHHHIIDFVDESGNRQREVVRVILRVQREVVTCLRMQVLITEDDLWFPSVQAEIMIIEFVQSGSPEARRIGCPEIEMFGRNHQGDLRCHPAAKGLMVIIASAQRHLHLLDEVHLVLCIGCQVIDMVVHGA